MSDFKLPKVAMIGCGYWGKNLVRNFHAINALAAVCDPNSETAKIMSEQYGVPSMTWDEILVDQNIDAVGLAVPAEMHAEMATKAILSGKHVYVEKPIALDIKDAEELVKLAEQYNRNLMVGHLLQYHPIFLKLKETVQNGKIGALEYVYSNRLSLGKFRSEEDVLWSFAPHDISMVLGLIGEEPNNVKAVGHCILQKDIADTTITHLSFPSGVGAHIFTSWLHPYKHQCLVAVGEHGMLVFDDTKDWNEKLAYFAHKIVWTEGVPPVPEKADAEYIIAEQTEPLKNECQHFIDSITNKTTPRTDGREGTRVLKVLDAASQSMRTQRHG